jgi:YfiR/HmsC-like
MDSLPFAASCPRTNPAKPFARGWVFSLLALLLMLAQGRTSCAADPLTLGEDQIKAGFLYNFTRFVTWPDNAFATATSPLSICIVGDTPLTDPLTKVAAGKVVDGRAVSVMRMKVVDDLRGCNLLFISSQEERYAVRILDSVKGRNVLTVGEDQGVLRAGGIIIFFIEQNRVKLEINLDAAARTGLKISAKLIAVSRLVSPTSDGRSN